MQPPRVLRSRFSLDLLALTLAPAGGILAVVASPDDRAAIAPVLGLISGLMAGLWCMTRYSLAPDGLQIAVGPFTTAIPYAEMRRVERSYSLLSAPAWSLRRLAIHYRAGEVALLSPQDEAAFLALLRRHAPHVAIDVR